MITQKIVRFNGWKGGKPPHHLAPSFTIGNTYPVIHQGVTAGHRTYTIRDNRGKEFCFINLRPGGAFELVDEGSLPETAKPVEGTPEYSGGSSSYYTVEVNCPTTPGNPKYIAECNDIIEALGMNFAEGNAFKALWRRAAQRTLGKRKAGAKDDGLYDAEKVEFFGARLVAQSKAGKK